ncbi:hypothetical protein ABZ829_28000 [Streptomyces xanthochromogenes]|uniref:hypothetical protein n=1 Tax=Streptomyces xanthochromogenes TaxID=67384 RepID=UPI00342D68B0
MAEEKVDDIYLQALSLLVAQSPENSAGITLTVPGAVVRGELVGHEAWTAAWAVQMRALGRGTGVEAVAGIPDQVERLSAVIREEMGLDPAADAGHGEFLHLRNATIVTGAPGTSISGVLWRGRVSDVSGWSMGN